MQTLTVRSRYTIQLYKLSFYSFHYFCVSLDIGVLAMQGTGINPDPDLVHDLHDLG